jgi:hypothetical protein
MHTALLLQKISECTISSLHHQQTQSIGTDAKEEKDGYKQAKHRSIA